LRDSGAVYKCTDYYYYYYYVLVSKYYQCVNIIAALTRNKNIRHA